MPHRDGLAPLILSLVAAVVGAVGYFVHPVLAIPNVWADRLFLSLLIVSAAFIVREILMHHVHPKLTDRWASYLFRKITLVVFWAVTFYVILTIWVVNITFLPVTLGLLAAGLAVAFQRPIMSILGLFVILVNRPFRVGDRIEVKGLRGETLTRGDVIDIRALYTSVLEVGEWMEGDVWTGRIVTVPNYRFLENEVANSTKEFGYIWDTVTIPITFSSDLRKARLLLIASIEKVVGHLKKPAQEDILAMGQRYYSAMEDTEPKAYITIRESWIELGARYITVPRGRRTIRSRIQQEFLERVRGDPDIILASPQLRVYPFPPETYRAGMRGETVDWGTAGPGEARAPPPEPPGGGWATQFRRVTAREQAGAAGAERRGFESEDEERV